MMTWFRRKSKSVEKPQDEYEVKIKALRDEIDRSLGERFYDKSLPLDHLADPRVETSDRPVPCFLCGHLSTSILVVPLERPQKPVLVCSDREACYARVTRILEENRKVDEEQARIERERREERLRVQRQQIMEVVKLRGGDHEEDQKSRRDRASEGLRS